MLDRYLRCIIQVFCPIIKTIRGDQNQQNKPHSPPKTGKMTEYNQNIPFNHYDIYHNESILNRYSTTVLLEELRKHV